MKIYLLGFSFLMALPLMANAFMLYDIDFEPPAYTNGQMVGGGSAGPVSSSINGFITQALLLQNGGGITYYSPESYTSGIHRISWDFAVPVEQSASTIISARFDGNVSVIPFRFATDMSTDFTGPVIGYPGGTTPFNFGQSYSFEVLMDLDADYYDFWLDGILLNDHVGIAPDTDLGWVSFGQGQYIGLQAGLDNFKWEVNSAIPEPGTVSLLLLGLPALGLARHLIPTQKKQASE